MDDAPIPAQFMAPWIEDNEQFVSKELAARNSHLERAKTIRDEWIATNKIRTAKPCVATPLSAVDASVVAEPIGDLLSILVQVVHVSDDGTTIFGEPERVSGLNGHDLSLSRVPLRMASEFRMLAKSTSTTIADTSFWSMLMDVNQVITRFFNGGSSDEALTRAYHELVEEGLFLEVLRNDHVIAMSKQSQSCKIGGQFTSDREMYGRILEPGEFVKPERLTDGTTGKFGIEKRGLSSGERDDIEEIYYDQIVCASGRTFHRRASPLRHASLIVREGMPMYRNIETSMWSDPKIKVLTPEGKLLFLYLITNNHAHVSGIYYLPLVMIAHETGLTHTVLDTLFDTLSHTKLAFRDAEYEVIWVVNMLRYQGSGGQIKKAVEHQLKTLHHCPLLTKFLAYYKHLSLKYAEPDDTLSDTLLDTVSDTSPRVYQEQEQYQEQKQEQEQDPPPIGPPPQGDEPPKAKGHKRGKRSPETPCPETYTPTHTQQAYALEHDIPLAKEVAKFLSNHRSKGHTMVSWEDAFWTWLHNFEQFNAHPARASPAMSPADRKTANNLAARDAFLKRLEGGLHDP